MNTWEAKLGALVSFSYTKLISCEMTIGFFDVQISLQCAFFDRKAMAKNEKKDARHKCSLFLMNKIV